MIDSHRDEIAKLESLYAMNPEGRVFTHLAEACRKAGQLERARQILEEGLQKHPDYASAHVVLGRVFADSDEDDAAASEFRRVLELDRHNLVALRSLGEIAARSGRTDEAMHYYGELAILDPTDPEIQETLRGLRDRPAAAPPEPAQLSAEAVEPEPLAGGDEAAEPIDAAKSTAREPDERSETDEPAGSAEPAEAELAEEDEPRAEEPVAEAAMSDAEDAQPSIEAVADETADDTVAVHGIEVEGIESVAAEDVGEVARLEGLVSDLEPEPTDAWPDPGTADLPEWPSAESAGEPPLPGESEPIDHAAWQQIAAGGTVEQGTDEPLLDDSLPAGSWPDEPVLDEPSLDEASPDEPLLDESSPDELVAGEPSGEVPEDEDAQPFVAASGEVTTPLNEDHLRFVPPGMFGRPEEAGAASAASAEEDEDEPAGEIEGRWQAPESSHGDVQAERDRPTDHSGEWIPADRWEWVAASADTSGSAGPPEPDEEPEEESSPETGGGSGPSAWDEETSFAGLTDDDDTPAAYGIDDEISFAGLTDEDADDAILESAPDEEVSFAGIAEDEPVDSFEEGAAAVLDAYARSEEEPASEEPEGDDAQPAFVTDPRTGEDDAPVSWVTESEDDSDLVITETLAEIYASQGLYDRAAAVYRRLIDQHPEDDRLHARLADLETATGWAESGEAGAGEAEDDREAFLERVESAWTGGEGAASMEDSPYAWAQPEREEAETGPRAADYFADLLAWRPTEAVPSTSAEPADAGAPPLAEDWYSEESEREPAEGASEDEVGREGEEDLEMFRSWLKSLKK